MEYAISAVVTIFFVFLYFALKPKDRESFTKKLNDDAFKEKLEKFASSNKLPKENGKKEYSVKKFVRYIGFAKFVAKRHLDNNHCQTTELKHFVAEIENNTKDLKKLKKLDFSKLGDLPSFENGARIEIVARALLEHNDFLLVEEKIATCFKIFNKVSTLTYTEINNFSLVIKFLYLEKLYYLSNRAVNLVKLDKYALKVARHPKNYEQNKFYNGLKDNNVFLHLTAKHRGEDCAYSTIVYFDVLQNLCALTSKIFDGLKFVDFVGFVKFYSPIEIFENYENFASAPDEVKSAFLSEASSQSSKLNMDEFAFSYALKKFVDRATNRYTPAFSTNLAGKKVVLSFFKKDMKLLATALSSRYAMITIFGGQNKKIILKKSVFKNTFANYQQQNTIKLGVFVSNGKLSINPHLSRKINEVDVHFTEFGVNHHLKIEKSDCRELYCNGTKYTGIPVIQLKDKPLDIHLKVPPKD